MSDIFNQSQAGESQNGNENFEIDNHENEGLEKECSHTLTILQKKNSDNDDERNKNGEFQSK